MKSYVPGESLPTKNIHIFSRFLALLTSRALQGVSSLPQLFKFIFVGVFNTALSYGIFLIFLGYASYIGALIIAHIIGVLNSFIWNKYWTFRSNELRIDEFLKFNSVYIIYFIVNAILLTLLVNNFNLSPQKAQLIALPLLTVVSFAGQKYWSFRKT